jgi:hypothetical protein
MTLLLLMEDLDAGRLSLEDTVTASSRAASFGGSCVFLEAGEQMSVHEMLKCITVVSANDCAVAMAEHVSGTEELFVARMNAKAEELGLENTHFTNCTGLFDDSEHYSTARDIAIMSRELIRHERIKEYFNATVPTDGTNVSVHSFETTSNVISHFGNDKAWPATADTKPTDFSSINSVSLIDFPQKLYHVAPGSAHYLFDRTKQQFFYVENYSTAAVGNTSGFTVESYYYPAELLYFGNSPIRVSNKEHKPNAYPNGVGNWDTDASWSEDWLKDSHVTSKTQSVAMKNDINYGTALMKTTVSYGATTLKDNNHAIQKYKDPSIGDNDEPDNEITVNGASFKVVGVVISGQSKQVGWDFLPKTGSAQGYVYDYSISSVGAIPATGSSVPNYTLVFDNYNATAAAESKPQDKVYVALELYNNSGSDFFGEHGVIRDGGTFYLIGELDPAKAGLQAPAWPANHPLPPYNADGSSKKIARVFMQDYMTSANFVIGVNSLKHAYLTVPDLRYSSLTLGLSVDIQWSTGLDFGDVVLGAE